MLHSLGSHNTKCQLGRLLGPYHPLNCVLVWTILAGRALNCVKECASKDYFMPYLHFCSGPLEITGIKIDGGTRAGILQDLEMPQL